MSERLTSRPPQNQDGRFFVPTRCRGSRCTVIFRGSPSGPVEIQGYSRGRSRNLFGRRGLEGRENMIEIRKLITIRETVFSELGVEAARPIAGIPRFLDFFSRLR